MTQNTKHKHADLIIQWALGNPIEVSIYGKWQDSANPSWDEDFNYRVKQEVKPDIVVFAKLEESLDAYQSLKLQSINICGRFSTIHMSTDNVKVTYSGETGRLLSIEMIE